MNMTNKFRLLYGKALSHVSVIALRSKASFLIVLLYANFLSEAYQRLLLRCTAYWYNSCNFITNFAALSFAQV